MNKLKTYLLLIAIFLISVLVRVPHLDRPLSKHHEFCTAIVLIPLQNWAENGASTYRYSPSITFEGTANQHIENLTAYPVEAEGRYYYLSHPPFAYLLPYFCFQILGVYPTPLALQIFNLLFHLLSCLLIYEIVRMITGKTSEKIHFDSLTAFLIYLFAPATLWFHGNAYMSDMFISNIFILGIWLVLKAFLRGEKTRMPDSSKVFDILHVASTATVIFLMIYTEWLGNFFAFGVFVLALIKAFSKKEKGRRRYYLAIAGACVCGVVGGLALIFWQYSSIAGFEVYWAYFSHRFGARSGAQFSDNGIFYFLWKYTKMTLRIGRHYATGFLPVFLLGAVLWGALFSQTKKIIQPANTAARYFWWLAGFPILMHHLVFVEFTLVHDFAVLKGGILLAVGIGLLVEKLAHHKSIAFKSGAFVMVFLCIAQYYYINRPGKISQNGDLYNYMQTLGENIRNNTQADELIFLNGYKPDPQVMYYARRNMLRAADSTEVKTILEERGAVRGVLFTIKNYKIENIEKINASQKY